MTVFKVKNFKKLCYDIEAMLNRSWLLTDFSGENYPKTFYYGKFQIQDISEKQILLLCNKAEPIFAFVDPAKVETFDYFKTGFVQNEQLAEVLMKAMNNSQVSYTMLSPEILLLEFDGKNDFTEKFKNTRLSDQERLLLFESLRPEVFNYKLFHGHNIGLDLFNSDDD